MNKKLGLIFAMSFVGLVALGQKKRPNIIVFLIDDMGWQDTSVPFWNKKTGLNETFNTPNMERLAKEGMKFTNAYAAPVCTPTRTAMMSGMNPAHSRITTYTSTSKDSPTDLKDDQLSAPVWNYNGVSPIKDVKYTQYITPLAKFLLDGGYTTIHVGKAHFGSSGTPGSNPYNLGFEVNISGHAAGQPGSYLAQDFYGNKPGKGNLQSVPDLEEYYGSETFLTEALTLESIKAIDKAASKDRPFFLNFAHYAVHTPIMADQKYYQKYIDQGLSEPEAKYASLVEGMDKSLGDVMDHLKKKGIADNTVIIFMSDNGGLDFRFSKSGTLNTHNYPLRAGKGSVFEGGIREPMIVKWPGIVKPGSTAHQYVIIEDFFPSILEIAGVKTANTVQQIDGKSFVPVLKNPEFKNDKRVLVWHHPNKWTADKYEADYNFLSAVRQGDWKLIYDQRDGKKQLYNLKQDISEKNDLSAQQPEMVKKLTALLSDQLKKWKAQMPVDKQTNKEISYPQ